MESTKPGRGRVAALAMLPIALAALGPSAKSAEPALAALAVRPDVSAELRRQAAAARRTIRRGGCTAAYVQRWREWIRSRER